MNRLANQNSWYGWSDLQGNWGSLNFDGFIKSSIGKIELPVWGGFRDNPLYLVGGNYKGKFLMGAQSQNGNGTIFYTDGAWWILNLSSFGMSCCAFNQDGSKFYGVINATQALTRDNETGFLGTVSDSFFVDGIRGVVPPNDKILLGNTTKYSEKFNLYEYIEFSDDVAVGQGSDGMVIYYKGTSYKIEPGDTYFIRAMFDGYNFALATVKQNSKECIHWWVNVDELKYFPVVGEDDIVAVGKPLYLGWFEFNQPPSINPPGNAITAIRFPNESGTIKLFNGRQFATWIDGQTVAEINARVAACPTPALAYWDGRNWPEWPILRQGDFLGMFGYCYADETPAIFEANLRALLGKVPFQFQDIAVICQCFTSNASLTKDLKGLVPVYARIARDNPRVTFLNVFSDQGRATGLNDHPELRAYWDKLAAGITGIPDNGGGMVNWAEIDRIGKDRWAELEVQKISQEMVDRGEDCRPFQQQMFIKICRELYCDKQIDFDFFWKHGVPNYEDPADVIAKLAHIGEDIIVDVAAKGYRDVVARMGHPTAEWNAGGADSPITPGDEAHCSHPPCDSVPGGDVKVFIMEYDKMVRRSDPNGMLVRFEIASQNPVVEVILNLSDDEPAIPIYFDAKERVDGRYVRALAFKPTVNGDWLLSVHARDSEGHTGEAVGPVRVHVYS